jgi:hypothetical protein
VFGKTRDAAPRQERYDFIFSYPEFHKIANTGDPSPMIVAANGNSGWALAHTTDNREAGDLVLLCLANNVTFDTNATTLGFKNTYYDDVGQCCQSAPYVIETDGRQW